MWKRTSLALLATLFLMSPGHHCPCLGGHNAGSWGRCPAGCAAHQEGFFLSQSCCCAALAANPDWHLNDALSFLLVLLMCSLGGHHHQAAPQTAPCSCCSLQGVQEQEVLQPAQRWQGLRQPQPAPHAVSQTVPQAAAACCQGLPAARACLPTPHLLLPCCELVLGVCSSAGERSVLRNPCQTAGCLLANTKP